MRIFIVLEMLIILSVTSLGFLSCYILASTNNLIKNGSVIGVGNRVETCFCKSFMSFITGICENSVHSIMLGLQEGNTTLESYFLFFAQRCALNSGLPVYQEFKLAFVNLFVCL